MTLTTVLLVAAGTYAFRVVGPLVASRVEVPERVHRILVLAAVTLLAALVVTQALTQDGGLAGWARPAGVAVAAVVAWRWKASLIVVVAVAAVTTAVLRLLGLP